MNYRQWKKNYKTKHGVNPPLELDKRKQAKVAKKALRQIANADMQKVINNVSIGLKSLSSRMLEFCGSLLRDFGNVLGNCGENMIETARNIEN